MIYEGITMEYFLYTKGTMPKGFGFSHFDMTHLAWLLFAMVVVICSCYHYKRLSMVGRSHWKKCIAILLIADELFKQACLIIGGRFTLGYLPLHLCNINIILIAVHAFKPSKTIGNFLYTVCLPGTVAALLFPNWTKMPVMNFLHLHSFTLHILLAVYPAVLTFCGEIKPRVKDIPRCLGLLLSMAAVIYVINVLLDENFFYLMEAPKGNPLYWFQQHWGDHRLAFPVLIGAVVAVMYIPIELWEAMHRNEKRIPKTS